MVTFRQLTTLLSEQASVVDDVKCSYVRYPATPSPATLATVPTIPGHRGIASSSAPPSTRRPAGRATSDVQIVAINWAALAPMSAPIWVELLPTCAATAENGRFCSGTKEYWAEGSTTFPPKSTKGNEPRSCPATR